jgi:hypothetical protein
MGDWYILEKVVEKNNQYPSADMLYILVSHYVGQTVGYGIGIAAEFVRQLSKLNSIQYRKSNTGKSGPGGI